MRNISFMLTTEQIRNRTKTVTRRLGWRNVKVGERLQGCVKCMGRKHGEPLVKLAVIEVVSVRRERLNKINYVECILEGFPEMRPRQFVSMFVAHTGCKASTTITRIEFKYVPIKSRCMNGHESTQEVQPNIIRKYCNECELELLPA